MLRDLATHREIEKANPDHNVKLHRPYRRIHNGTKSMKREFDKLLENPQFKDIYFRCLLDGSIIPDFAKIPFERAMTRLTDIQNE